MNGSEAQLQGTYHITYLYRNVLLFLLHTITASILLRYGGKP